MPTLYNIFHKVAKVETEPVGRYPLTSKEKIMEIQIILAIGGVAFFLIFFEKSKKSRYLSTAIFVISVLLAVGLCYAKYNIEEWIEVFRPFIVWLTILIVPLFFSKLERNKNKGKIYLSN